VKYTIDRFEGGFAVCEDENTEFANIAKKLLPKNFKEGTYFEIDENGNVNRLDNSERRARIESLMKQIWK